MPSTDEPDGPVTGEEPASSGEPDTGTSDAGTSDAGTSDTEEPAARGPDAQVADTGADPAAPAGSRRKVALISAAVVVVLAVAGLVVYLVTRDDSAETATGDPDVPTIEGTAPPADTGAPTTGSVPQSMSRSSAAPPPPSGEDAGEAQSVAEQAATAISNADADALVQLSCDPDSVGADDTLPDDAKVEVVGEPQITGDTATIDVRVTVPGAEPANVPMPLIKQDGRWCIPS